MKARFSNNGPGLVIVLETESYLEALLMTIMVNSTKMKNFEVQPDGKTIITVAQLVAK